MSTALRQTPLDFAADLHKDADQVGDVAAGIVDVGLQKDGVPRRLVELDVVAACQQPFELRASEPGGTANERDARRVEAELVLLHAAPRQSPVGLGGQIISEAALAILCWHHLVSAKNAEIFRDQ